MRLLPSSCSSSRWRAQRQPTTMSSVSSPAPSGFGASIGQVLAAVLLLLLILGVPQAHAQSAANGSILYHTTFNCASCHGATPRSPQLNAAGASGVLSYAIAQNFGAAMGSYRHASIEGVNGAEPLSASQRADLAAYFAQVLGASFPASVNVAYHGAVSNIPLKLTKSPHGEFNAINYSSVVGGSVADGTPINFNSDAAGTPMQESTATYTHTANNCSAASFTATASGNAGSSSPRVVNITVTPPAAPSASSASPVAANFNSATNIPITLGGGPAASVSIVSGLSNGGSLVTNGTTSFTYTSNAASYAASDSFTYRVNGPCGATSSNVTVNLNIAAPQPATPNVTTSAPYNPGPGAPAPTAIVLTGSVANTVTGVTITSAPAHGAATVSGTTVNYTPAAGNLLQDSFQYLTTGPGGASAGSGTVTINITPPGAPTISQPININVPYNAGGAAATNIPLAGYVTGSLASIAITGVPALGSAVVAGTAVNYTPAVANLNPTSFQFTATAPGGATSAAATVSINITPPGAPVTQNRAVSTPFNTAASFDLAPSISGIYNSITLGPASAGGNVSIAGSTVIYTPAPGYSGTETFTYTATAPGGANTTSTVTMTVIALPAVANLTVDVPYNTAKSFTLPVGGFTQINTTPPAHGTLSVPAPGSANLSYTPAAGYTGDDSFSYTATGPGGTSAAATVIIKVGTLTPAAGAAAMTVPLNTPTSLDLAPYITGSSISGVSIAKAPAHGTVSVNGTRVTYAPVNNYFGSDSFSYTAYGNGGTSPSAAVVSVTVTGRPDPSKDATVAALIGAQVEAARRFSKAQISNFQARMESLHRRPGRPDGGNTGFATLAGTPASSSSLPSAQQHHARPSGAAFKPAASLSSNPAAGLSLPAPSQMQALPTLLSALTAAGDANGDTSALGKTFALAAGATQGSFQLSSSTGKADGESSLPGSVDFWVGGGIKFGTRNHNGVSDGLSFSTDGISVGVDRRFSNALALGLGLGYARDRSEIGNDGSNSKAKGLTLAAYGSYQPTEHTFIDAMLGVGSLDFQSERFVAPVSDFARSTRSGRYWFGSLAAGVEYLAPGLLLSPYGRLDIASARLNRTTETGAGLYALTYDSQSIPSLQFSLGLRAESAHETSFGYVLPRLRVEVQHDFKGAQQASVSYADLLNGPSYAIASTSTNRNALVLGVGADFLLRRGLNLSLDYQTQRSPGQENSQALFLKLVKELDGGSSSGTRIPTMALSAGSLGIRADAGFLFDDNVSRGSWAADQRIDSAYSLNLSRRWVEELGAHTRLLVSGFAGGEKFRTYSGLSRVFAGAEGELQYRESGDFDSPIYALFGNLTLEQYESDLRDGYRYAAGVSVLKPLTDRITLFGALARNVREGRSAVFDTRDVAVRGNLDYALKGGSTLYLGGEYRRGDIVASGLHRLASIDVAKVFVRDDVFTREGFYDYRFEGRTVLLTLGYNLPFGPRDALDLSWRRIRSTPDRAPSPGGSNSYVSNQFSIVYLTRF